MAWRSHLAAVLHEYFAPLAAFGAGMVCLFQGWFWESELSPPPPPPLQLS